jgi:hypothetical protein
MMDNVLIRLEIIIVNVISIIKKWIVISQLIHVQVVHVLDRIRLILIVLVDWNLRINKSEEIFLRK